MARIINKATIKAEITLVLHEEEAAALDAIAGYGTDAFLKVFYAHLGVAYLKPHEAGLRSLFDSVRNGNVEHDDHVTSITGILQRIKQARETFEAPKA